MLKKAVFVAAMLLITGAVYAAQPGGVNGNVSWEEWDNNANIKAEVYNWPATYDYQPIIAIPVKMDVGFWIRIDGYKDLVMKLRQVAIRKYQGSITGVNVHCNVDIQLAVDFSLVSGFPGAVDYKTVTPSTLAAPGGTITLSAGIKDVNLQNLTPTGDCIDVGTLTLKVRPNITPTLPGGC